MSYASEPPRPKESLPLIDVLRGLAAFWVVLYHVRVDLWVGFQEIAQHPERYTLFQRVISWISLPASFGGGGVMLFFLLSGFCIHLPYVAAPSIEWKSYLARRFWRIYPPYAVAVLLTVGCELAARCFNHGEIVSSTDKVVHTFVMVQNYGKHPGQMPGNAAFWSLPVEFELYLVYPVFLWLLRTFGAFYTCAVVGTMSLLGTVLSLRGYPWMGGNFIHYWLIWCSGALLAEGWRMGTLPRFRTWYLLLLAGAGGAAVYVRIKDFAYPIQHYAWALPCFLLLWGGLQCPQVISSLPVGVRKQLLWLGLISYSLYLIHYPIFLLTGAMWTAALGTKPVSFLVPLAASFLVLPLAWLFWRCIEMPSHIFGRRLARKVVETATPAVVPSA